MKSSQLVFKGKVHRTIAGDIASTARTVTVFVKSVAKNYTMHVSTLKTSTMTGKNETNCMVLRTTGLLPIPK